MWVWLLATPLLSVSEQVHWAEVIVWIEDTELLQWQEVGGGMGGARVGGKIIDL